MSGSFVASGSGLMRADRIGMAAYATQLTAEARKFSTTHSELVGSIMRFVRTITWVLIPLGILLFVSQMQAAKNWQEALRLTVAGAVTMVPEGLVLLTSIAMAVAVIRLGAKRTLVQEMPAVEVLARVDVVCVDKTGTLTEPGMHVRQVVALDGTAPVGDALGALGASEDNPNPTLAAVVEEYPAPSGWPTTATVPFSSARKWSAARFGDHGWWVFGAPEVLLPDEHQARAKADDLAAGGARVLLLARSDAPDEEGPDPDRGTGPLTAVALVVIDQRLRSDAADTVQYFLDQGVTIKVISGDNPVTVGAIAGQAGIPGGDDPFDARELPEDREAMAEVLETHGVFGRVTPAQKRAMVGALQSRGHTVAMTGDGVNDVLALKDSDLGIAMGSGAGATRAVAQIVLLDSQFSVMPSVVAEGRRVLGNIERVSDLFLTKSFYAAILSFITVVLTLTRLYQVEFLFLPRHLTVISALTIGIPAFFLALMPNAQLFRPGFFARVLTFAIPAGFVSAVSAFTSYVITLQAGNPPDVGRVSATTTLFMVTWTVLFLAARPMNLLRWLIVLSMATAFLIILFVPLLSTFFALDFGADADGLIAVACGVVGSLALWAVSIVVDRRRAEKGEPPTDAPDPGCRRHDGGVAPTLSPVAPTNRADAVRVPDAKVALSTVSTYPENAAAAFEIAARLGYDGVEVMVMTDQVSQDPEALQSLSDHYAVPILAIHAPCLLVTQRVWGTDPWVKLVRAREAAELLGARTVVVHPPFRWQRDYSRDFVRGLRRMGDETDIRFAVENMYPWRARNRELMAYAPGWDVRDEDYPHTTLDLSHTAVSQSDALQVATDLGDSLVHVHLADGTGSARDEHLIPGRGSQPCAALLEQLARRSFDGTVVVEVSTRKAATRAEREEELAEALAFARLHLAAPVQP